MKAEEQNKGDAGSLGARKAPTPRGELSLNGGQLLGAMHHRHSGRQGRDGGCAKLRLVCLKKWNERKLGVFRYGFRLGLRLPAGRPLMDATTPAVVDTDVVSFLFKTQSLAPAYQDILGGRQLAVR
ncbi:MAG: hypothetical protein ABSG65_15550 [Bryobacteraceae bacterium]